MRFARPELLVLLVVALPAIAAWGWWTAARRRRALAGFAGGEAWAERFRGSVNPNLRTIRFLLVLVAAAAGIVASARPQWGTRLEPVTSRGVDVVFILDVSTSMAATDVAPDRLGRATHGASSLLAKLGGDRVALVTFAGRAVVACPLTPDLGAVDLFLDAVDVESVPVGGTALSEALAVAAEAFGTPATPAPENRDRVVVLWSDGEDHEGAIESGIAAIREAGAAVHTLGVGTRRGGPIPLRETESSSSGYKKDANGNVVTTRLEEETLERIATATGGRYFRATPGETEIEAISDDIGELEGREAGTILRTRYEERYQVPLAIALVAMLAASAVGERRRGEAR